jgi:hypothetical protein
MSYFFPDESKPITSEMIRQDCTPDAVEALRITRIDEQAASTDVAFSICGAAVSIASICGIAALAGFTLPILVPIASLGVSTLWAWNAKVTQRDREEESLFLNEHPEILDAIKQKIAAGEDRDRIAAAYELAIEAFFHGHKEPLKHLGYSQSQPLPASPVADPVPPVASPQPIGTNTRLGSIAVPASPAGQSNWQTPTQIAVSPVVSKLREVCDRNNSFYIAGSKGSGKGIFASNLIRWKLDQYPNAIALVLDPKGDVKEAGYWQHERIRHFAFRGIALSSEQYAEKVIEFLGEARNLVSQADVARGMRLFLVLDELLTLKESISNALFTEFRRFGVSAISTGDSEGIHLIAITQSFNAGDSFGSDELLKNFTQVGLFRQDEYIRAKKLIQFGRSNGELTEAEFKALISQSEKDRVMSIAGEFIPTPTLTNYSAFDRDEGRIIKQLPLGSNLSEGDILASELTQKIQQMTAASSDSLTKPEGENEEQILIEYVRKKAPIKIREIVQSGCLKKVGITSTRDYQTFLDILVAEAKLTVDNEGTYS